MVVEKPGGRSTRLLHERQGSVATTLTWTDKRPHPPNMLKYETLNKDPEVRAALTSLTDMTVGVGFYTSMGENEDQEHDHKGAVDKWCEKVNLDKMLWDIEYQCLGKGIAPVLRNNEGGLELLPAETFWRYQKPTGDDYKFTQEISGSVVNKWEGADLNRIAIFANNETPTRPYGLALIDGLEERIEQRQDMAEDVPEVIHKYAYPFRVWESETKTIGDVVYNQAVARQPDEDIFLDGVPKDALRIRTEVNDTRINFTQYITHNDEQIAEGLMAPLLMYLRNSTDANAQTILDTIERRVQSRQRYDKRLVEAFFFKPLVGDPVPRLNFGAPKTGLEDVTVADIAALSGNGTISPLQAQSILKRLGVPIDVEPVDPLADQPEVEMMKIPKGLNASLATIEAAYREKRITLVDALREGDKSISASLERGKLRTLKGLRETVDEKIERLSPANEALFKAQHNELFNHFKQRLLPGSAKEELKTEHKVRVVLDE